jgi:hypothetical protein
MQQNQPFKSSTLRSVSAAGCAVLLFFLVNLALRFKPLEVDRYDFPYHGWSYWSVNAIRNMDASRVNVVLLGSSLVVSAIAECDATVKNKQLDLCYYRGAQYFDERMRDHFGRDYSTIDLSIPGQIPSDAYLTMKAALANGITPGAVVYGVAPRDFIDQTLKDATDTDAFHYLSRLVDMGDCAPELYHTPVSQLDWNLQRLVYLYSVAPSYCAAARNSIAQRLEPLLLAATAGSRQQVMNVSVTRSSPDFPTANIDPGTHCALVAHDRGPFLDNLDDYKNRYKQPDAKKYQTQMQFLQKLIGLCQSNQIKLILVNMPITKRNVDLLAPAWRERYFHDLQTVCTTHDVPFIDACDFSKYAADDYRDTVHLNAFGARKFIDLLTEQLAKQPASAQAILSAGLPVKRAVAEHTAASETGIH